MSTESSRLENWAARARERRPAVVMGMAATGLSYVRSLHRHGIPTLLVNERGWIGTPSRYELTVDLPPIKDSADIWLRTLVAAAERSSRRPVLLVGPTTRRMHHRLPHSKRKHPPDRTVKDSL